MEELSRVTRDFFKPSSIPERFRARRARRSWQYTKPIAHGQSEREFEFEFEWGGGGGVYALSASKAIFRVRTYNCIAYIQSGDDDYLMNETKRKPTTGRQSPSRCDLIGPVDFNVFIPKRSCRWRLV